MCCCMGCPSCRGAPCRWGRINPLEARDFLIRQGLVEGEIQQRFAHDEFIDATGRFIEEAQEESNRTRQVAQTVSDEVCTISTTR